MRGTLGINAINVVFCVREQSAFDNVILNIILYFLFIYYYSLKSMLISV